MTAQVKEKRIVVDAKPSELVKQVVDILRDKGVKGLLWEPCEDEECDYRENPKIHFQGDDNEGQRVAEIGAEYRCPILWISRKYRVDLGCLVYPIWEMELATNSLVAVGAES